MNRNSLQLLRPMLLVFILLNVFLITYRSLQSSNPNSFVRAMYGGFIIKFFAVAIAAFIYIMITNKNVNKPALIACMLLYVVYTFIEVKTLLGLLKQKKNA